MDKIFCPHFYVRNEMFYCEVSAGGLDDIYNKLFYRIKYSFVEEP